MLLSFLAQAVCCSSRVGGSVRQPRSASLPSIGRQAQNRIGRALRSVYADTLTAPLTPRQVELSGMLQSRETDASG